MTTRLTRRTVLAALGSGAALAGCAGVLPAGDDLPTRPIALAPGTRILIVRHFDRDGEDLSDLGRARAAELPDVIADIPLDAIYTRVLGRNQDSARPLAEARGMEMQMLNPATVHERLLPLAEGRSVIWIGNRDNLRALWRQLGLRDEPPFTYGEVAIVTPGLTGRARVTRRMIEVADS